MKNHSRYNTARKILIFWCLFIGVGAVAGSVGMITAPDGSNLGMQEILKYFQVLPFADILFKDFLFSGIALLCVNGITNLTAAVLMIAKKKSGVVCGTVFGVTLMAWIAIQFVIFPSNFMSNIYFDFGILQAITGCAALIFYKQEHFSVDKADYPGIGTDTKKLVVYFSRMGYTKAAAYEEANRTGAEIFCVKPTERTDGTGGFWWCGRFGMHGWDMPIETELPDLLRYEQVTVCSPVWVFGLSAPIRSFCRSAHGRISSLSCIITHFNRFKCKKAITEIETLTGVTACNVVDICVRYGKQLYRKSLRRGETKPWVKL